MISNNVLLIDAVQKRQRAQMLRMVKSALLWSAVAAVLFFGWACWDLWVGHNATIEASGREARDSALLVSRSVEGAIGKIDVLLQQILISHGRQLAVSCNQQHDNASIDSSWNKGLASRLSLIPEAQSLRVSNAMGRFCFDASGQLPVVSVADRPYFLAHQRSVQSGLVVSLPVFSRVTQSWVVTVSRQLPRTADGRFNGIIQMALNQSFFESLVSRMTLPKGAVIGVFDVAGNQVVQIPSMPLLDGKVPTYVSSILASQQVTGVRQGTLVSDNPDTIIAWSRSSHHLVTVVLDEEKVLTSWRQRVRMEFAFCFLASVAWCLPFLSWRHRLMQAQAGQHAEQARSIALLDSLLEMAWFRSVSGEYLAANPALTRFCGRDEKGVEGCRDEDIWPTQAAKIIRRLSDTALNEGGATYGEIMLEQHGERRYFEVSCVPSQSGDAVAGIARDVTEQRKQQDLLQKQAQTDALTGLPNRLVIDQHLSVPNESMAVLYVDLDNFKTVNDTLGHRMGDLLLIEAGRRLQQVCLDLAVCCRLGGDEFLLISHNMDELAAAQLGERVVARMAVPYALNGAEVTLGASVGIALCPDHARDAEGLLMAADLALYEAKAAGRQVVRFYTASMGKAAREKIELDSKLRKALDAGQLSLHYQPQLSPDGEVKGYEALMRWHHPELGSIPPTRFIPLAEETGLIRLLGSWALREAADFSVRMRKAGLPSRVAVNVSASQLVSGALAGEVEQVISQHGIDPEDLEIEITESMLMQSTPSVRQDLLRIRQMGVAVALDDFGTGYSSLAQLSSLPISRIKMDRSFVMGLPDVNASVALAETVCHLGRRLGLHVIAEGVETFRELDFLRDSGCQEVQGFYFARAMPEEHLLPWLRARQPAGHVPLGRPVFPSM